MATPDSAKATKKKETGISSAAKRILQSEKRRLRNRSFQSKIKTLLKDIQACKTKEELPSKLSHLYSLMDKGVKKGIVTRNKAARVKSKYSHKAAV